MNNELKENQIVACWHHGSIDRLRECLSNGYCDLHPLKGDSLKAPKSAEYWYYKIMKLNLGDIVRFCVKKNIIAIGEVQSVPYDLFSQRNIQPIDSEFPSAVDITNVIWLDGGTCQPSSPYGGSHKIVGKEAKQFLDFINNIFQPSLPEEIADTSALYEGAVKQISINAYERNPEARQQCIDHYKYKCAVCNKTLEEIYGEAGKKLIHVHHLKELSSIGEEYEVDPIKDLRPVCPNCHTIIHSKKPAYTIEEVRDFYNN